MLHYQADLFNLNEKFSNMFCKSESKINSNILIKLRNTKELSMFCYWCENRSVMECFNCKRNFCKFCVKIDQSKVESNFLCLICGCFEITKGLSSGVACENKSLNVIDREMQDMLHRYENLCNNDKLANSVFDILINIDSINSSKVSLAIELIKLNIFSMLHDIQKLQFMINNAEENGRFGDIENVLIPLLKIITKHHVFKRLGKPVAGCDFQESENKSQELNLDNLEIVEKESSQYIDLANDNSMDMFQCQTDDSEYYERMQRSPLHLGEEEKFTAKFEIELKDDENDIDGELISVKEYTLNDSQESRQTNFTSIEDESVEKVISKRKRGRQLTDTDRIYRLRSETSQTCNSTNKNTSSFSTLQCDLTEAATVFKCAGINNQESFECDKKPKINSRKISKSSKTPNEEISFQSFLEMSRSFPSNDNNQTAGGLGKFLKIVQRSKNSHLVCPAPVNYEKPFLLKDITRADPLCDLKTISNKTWSWERQSTIPKCIIPIKTRSITNGSDLPKILTKPIVGIQKSSTLCFDPISIVSSNQEKPPQSSPKDEVQLKRTLSASSVLIQMDSGEPKKKRGRPRKYFNNFVSDTFNASQSCSSHDENTHHNSSHLSD